MTSNNNTNRENYASTTATPSPLPPKGAPALHREVSCGLAERKEQLAAKVVAFKEKFAKKPFQPLSQAEFERRRQEQKKRLGCKQ